MIHSFGKKLQREMIRLAAMLGSIGVLALLSHIAFAQEQAPKAPPTRQDNFREVIHGVEIIDPYRWLEDQESPETRQWIECAEQVYSLPALRPPVAPVHSKALIGINAHRHGQRAFRAGRPLLSL